MEIKITDKIKYIGVDDTDIKSALKSNRTFATISSAIAAGQMMGTQEAEPYKEYLAEFRRSLRGDEKK